MGSTPIWTTEIIFMEKKTIFYSNKNVYVLRLLEHLSNKRKVLQERLDKKIELMKQHGKF